MNVIQKAKISIQWSNLDVNNHFADISKMVQLGSWSERQVDDIMLTRYACYIIAMNWDSSKEEIAFAQQYFALQTRKLETIEQRILETERVSARKKLSETEKELSKVIYEQTWSDDNFAIIRSKWDKALFELSTQSMKNKWWITWSKSLADFMPTILLKAKDFATEITIFNTKAKNMQTENQISNEHITNNKSVRKTLLERWIVPENLSPSEDVKKLERKLKTKDNKEINKKWFKKK